MNGQPNFFMFLILIVCSTSLFTMEQSSGGNDNNQQNDQKQDRNFDRTGVQNIQGELFVEEKREIENSIIKVLLEGEIEKALKNMSNNVVSNIIKTNIEKKTQYLIDIMQKGMLQELNKKQLSYFAECFTSMVKNPNFDVGQFFATEGMDPLIISLVISCLKILNPQLEIPKDRKGNTIKTIISFADWAKYNDLDRCIKNENKQCILDLSNIGLSDLNDFEMIILRKYTVNEREKIDALDLSNNQLSFFPRDLSNLFPRLWSIYLDNNLIANLSTRTFSDYPNLGIISICNNLVSMVTKETFYNCPNLQWVRLNNNKINLFDKEAFVGCPKLSWLILMDNKISVLVTKMFSNLPGLTHLFLDNNPINTIQKDAIVDCPELFIITLKNNRLSKKENVAHGAFNNCSKLTFVNLDQNQNLVTDDLCVGCPSVVKFSDENELEYATGQSNANKTSTSLRPISKTCAGDYRDAGFQ